MTKDKGLILANYQPPVTSVTSLTATFDIQEDHVIVEASLAYDSTESTLFFHGENLELLELKIDGKLISSKLYQVNSKGLTIKNQPLHGVLTQKVRLQPQLNTELSGLYRSGPMLCTQCEAEGFRRILFYPDRPDVSAVFDITLIADLERYPVLLSNGNQVSKQVLADGRHQVQWVDPFPKPSYLFAIVAGNLALTHDVFVTKSGRHVDLKIYTDHGEESRTSFAMEALKKAMRWDEERYHLEYDLDVYHIVATHDFNMGAMENKSLNIFNAKYVLGDKETITDLDYQNILAVVGHEYFHNYTGNRVTLRDWFQLSLKEGLTVFREQQFVVDMMRSPMRRIEDVIYLINHQFPEDSSPLAHPVRPKHAQAIDNIYTATVYSKGAEVIRMLKFLIGDKNYYAGVDRYLKKFDGQSATIHDWLSVMSEVSGQSLAAFEAWYDYPHTPTLNIHYTDKVLHIVQEHPKHVLFVIPLSVAFWKDGVLAEEPKVHILKHKQTTLLRPEGSLPTFNHNFSAPINIKIDYSLADRRMLILAENDGVTSWLLMQDYWLQILHTHHGQLTHPDVEFFEKVVLNKYHSPALRAELLTPPTFEMLLLKHKHLDPLAYQHALERVDALLGRALKDHLIAILDQEAKHEFEPDAIDWRTLQCVALRLIAAHDPTAAVVDQYTAHPMMTLKMAALKALVQSSHAHDIVIKKLQKFYDEYKDNPLLVAKWLQLQALNESIVDGKLATQDHPAFDIKNPNKTYALIRTFCSQNIKGFHDLSGAGYEWWANTVKAIDQLNPNVASGIAKVAQQWTHWAPDYKERFAAVLEKIVKDKELSVNTKEVIEELSKAHAR